MQAALIGPSGQTFLGPAGLTIGRMQSNQYVVYEEKHRMWQSASVTPSQKVNDIPASLQKERSYEKGVSPSKHSHRKILVSVFLFSLILLGVIAFSAFEYLNRSTPEKTLANFCNALQRKDYESMYEQLSNKVQQLGSEKLIAENMSNVKDCTYVISKEY